jgi:caffeoyl-CoA O-methyltransferase
VLADNTFGFGEVYKKEFATKREADTLGGLQTFNKMVAEHPQFRATILPTGEGLTLGVKIC